MCVFNGRNKEMNIAILEFRIDEKTHPMERNNLRSMLTKNESISPNVKFIIISEPLPEEAEIKECEEVG